MLLVSSMLVPQLSTRTVEKMARGVLITQTQCVQKNTHDKINRQSGDFSGSFEKYQDFLS